VGLSGVLVLSGALAYTVPYLRHRTARAAA